MMGGLDGARRLMEQDVSKPKNVSATLARFGSYFRHHWAGFGLALLLIIGTTWTQVTAPDIIGQAVDCYLFPQPASCWYATVAPDASIAERGAGLLRIVGVLVALFVAGSVMNGIAFYAMSRAGQLVLRQMRADLFDQIHRLSLGFYARNEAGNIMSRLTSDTDTIQQAFGFALLNVLGGVLLIGWIML